MKLQNKKTFQKKWRDLNLSTFFIYAVATV